jgi:hypothetical protein
MPHCSGEQDGEVSQSLATLDREDNNTAFLWSVSCGAMRNKQEEGVEGAEVEVGNPCWRAVSSQIEGLKVESMFRWAAGALVRFLGD